MYAFALKHSRYCLTQIRVKKTLSRFSLWQLSPKCAVFR